MNMVKNKLICLLVCCSSHGAIAQVDSPSKELERRIERNKSILLGGQTLPRRAFDLDFSQAYSIVTQVQLPAEVGAFDFVNQSTIQFAPKLQLKAISRSRFDSGSAVGGIENLHSLCDPGIHVAFLPIETSQILYAGPDTLTLKSVSLEESLDTSNPNSNIACLAPREGGGFVSTLFSSSFIAAGTGRFACAEGGPITGVQVANEDPNPLDTLGIQAGGYI